MEKLQSYEQYTQVLAAFKEGRARCGTNKMQTREELTALIEAGKLYYAQTGETMWFFTNEGYFYTGVFYVPKDRPIEMRKQDMDVVVELFGREDRYNQQWEDELIAAGFDKGDKRLEYAAQLDEIIEEVKRQSKIMRAFWEKRGFTFRTATKADYPAVEALWLDKIGKDRYSVTPLTEAEQEEMEQYGRCPVICDPEGKIVAASIHFKKGKIAYGYISAAKHQGSGMGAASYYEEVVNSYQEGCTKFVSWIREDNNESISMAQRIQKNKTGKFTWQFVCKAL